MNKMDFELNFSTFKLAIILSVALMVMKIAGWIDISIWIILLPIFIAIGIWFFIVFLIGLFTLFILVKTITEPDESSEIEEKNES